MLAIFVPVFGRRQNLVAGIIFLHESNSPCYHTRQNSRHERISSENNKEDFIAKGLISGRKCKKKNLKNSGKSLRAQSTSRSLSRPRLISPFKTSAKQGMKFS